ncbi:spore germination protein [Dethiobacter alkaliphilus]|uniref:spore germination protein n=1 Tax=Dethiobacter alkaliphilus TaxID=427926 RepID=UPI002225BC9B|nr:spore germination protein [Dethiobacter alkaliphilus]MCW3490120.1 spore germination protein [Dethiobacter alkaliphilus]
MDVAPRDTQQMLRGYKKQFHEDLDYNLSLIKERLPSDNLILEQFVIGRLGKKRVVIAYLNDLANPDIVAQIRTKIRAIKAETLLDSSYLERNIENSNLSPFPQVETAIQPDLTEAALIQGRIAILLDGSPDILLAPTTFFDLMDTPEDAYSRWFIAANFFRIARYIMFLMAASLPAFYIALTSHNPEMLPTRLAMLIAASAEGSPFPVYFEAFVMMGVVEAVRLILIRVPNQIGSAIAIFAGIVLVGAGLSARIFGEIIVMVVTLTAIVSFAIPNYDLRSAVRIIQFFTMILSTMFGMFGFAVAFFYIGIHLVSLKSFGIPYMAPFAPVEASGWGHTVLRDNTVAMAQDETYQPLSKAETTLEKGDHDE